MIYTPYTPLHFETFYEVAVTRPTFLISQTYCFINHFFDHFLSTKFQRLLLTETQTFFNIYLTVPLSHSQLSVNVEETASPTHCYSISLIAVSTRREPCIKTVSSLAERPVGFDPAILRFPSNALNP